MNRAPLAATADPRTSHAAASDYTASGARTSDKARVLAALQLEPLYVTSAELAAHNGMDRYLVSRRLPDLKADGLVEQCNDRVCAIGGKRAMTWRAVRRAG